MSAPFGALTGVRVSGRARLTRLWIVFPLMGLACADDTPTSPTEEPHGLGPSAMSAIAEGNPFNAIAITAKNVQGYLAVEGRTWVGNESTLIIRFLIKAELGTQVIERTNLMTVVAADVFFDPTYDEPEAWTADRLMGSGTFTIASLSAARASGTFSFTARALGSH